MERSPIDIRPYESSDYDASRALCVELAEHHRLIYDSPGIGGDDPGAWWDGLLESSVRIGSWVAVEGGTVIGLAGLQTTDEEGVEVEPIIVSTAARGRGVGRLLMERLIIESLERGFGSLSVRSVARNTGALAAWPAMGFTTVGLVEVFKVLEESETEWRPGVVIDGMSFDH